MIHIGTGQVTEIYLDGSARIDCHPNLIPAPGQYLLAHASGSASPLPVPIFFYDSAPKGFRSAPLLGAAWMPGTKLNLRGPLGHGFSIPTSIRKVLLIAFDDSPARLNALISISLKQNAEVVLICNSAVGDMPEAVEVQPLQAISEIYHWADYVAVDVARENLNQLREKLGDVNQVKGPREAQVLVRAPMPCGALAECGVCALTNHHDWKMICKDGPVFELKELK